MKALMIIFLLLTITLYGQEYEVVKQCRGMGTYAIVVLHEEQYYVMETPVFFERQWAIRDLPGILHSGYQMLYYYDAVGANNSMVVRLLSRMRWRYSGESSAISLCRQITRG